MSQENVEIVRAYYEPLGRALDAYWDDPEVRFAESPFVSDVLDHHVHPEVQWKSVFAPDTTFTGPEELLQAVDTWLEFAALPSTRRSTRSSRSETGRFELSTTTQTARKPSKPPGYRRARAD